MTRAIPEPTDALDAGLTVRFTTEEREAIDSLAEERTRALRHTGGTVRAADVVRGAVRREIATAGKRKARAPR